MKNRISRGFVVLLTLLCSSMAMAATITVVPSTSTPGIGEQFTVLVSGADFPETAGATLGLTFNSSVVEVDSIALAGTSPFTGGIVANDPFASGDLISILGPLTGTLPSGSFEAFVVTFTTLAEGAANIILVDDQSDLCWTDAVNFTCVTPAEYTQASVTVTGAPTPDIAVTDADPATSDGTIAFGNVLVGSTNVVTFTVTNIGTVDLTNLAFETADAIEAPYALQNSTCGATLAASASCTVEVNFSPVAAGDFPSTFDITSDDPDEATVTFTLSGTATEPAPNAVVTDTSPPADDQSIDFGSIVQGQTTTQTVTITNDGTAVLNIGAIAAVDVLDPVYSLQNDTCSNAVVNIDANCTFDIQFAPASVNTFPDTFDIASDDPDGPVAFTLTGTGTEIPTPDIDVDDLTIDFPDTQIGTTSALQTITVTNSGTAGLILGTVDSSALGAAFSIGTDGCSGQTVAASGTCTITVDFTPADVQAYSGSLDVLSNDPDEGSVTVSLGGSGVPVPPADITVSDVSVDFANTAVGNTRELTVTVTNDGSDDLVLGTMDEGDDLLAPFSLTGDTCSNQTLAADESCEITVEFAPTETGSFDSSFDIPSNDSDEATITVQVSGTGVPEQQETGRQSEGGSVMDPALLIGLGALGAALKRRRRSTL